MPTAAGEVEPSPEVEDEDAALTDFVAASDDEQIDDDGGDADVGAVVETVTVAPYAEVEVTLVDLDFELAQLCDGFLEPLDADGQVDVSGNAAPDATLGVRLAYRVSYDPQADALDQVVFFPVRSSPAADRYSRVPAAVRRALPVVVLNSARPLQLRADGVLRRLIADRDAAAASAAFRALSEAVASATDNLSADPTIAGTVDAVLTSGGLSGHLADVPPTAATVRFRPEDGSLSALLRAVQPALDLDDAGLLTLSSHGSTAAAVLAAAEALLLAASVEGAVVLGDDFGDGLDAATAEHLAAVLRAGSGQVWLTTRRPEVARAFAPGELVRLSRSSAGRTHHLVPEPTDKKEVALRRLLHAQLLPAVTAPVVVIAEGPHDLTVYACADRYRAAKKAPLSASGVRLISADTGTGGGAGQVPRVAQLARSLGFRVIALVDGDPAKKIGGALAEIEAACDRVVRLPETMAIEAALLAGMPVPVLRKAAAILPAYGIDDPAVGKADLEVQKALIQTLHKKAMHEQLLEVIVEEHGSLPPVLDTALTVVAVAAKPANANASPKTIQLVPPPPSSPAPVGGP